MRFKTMTPQAFTFANSPFWPIAIGFFGLGTGYFIWGGQALFGYPKSGPESRSHDGDVGFLDARLLPIPHWRISHRGINLVQRFRKRGTALYGGRGIHRVRNPLVRDGASPLRR